jgi:hypothetical protein
MPTTPDRQEFIDIVQTSVHTIGSGAQPMAKRQGRSVAEIGLHDFVHASFDTLRSGNLYPASGI